MTLICTLAEEKIEYGAIRVVEMRTAQGNSQYSQNERELKQTDDSFTALQSFPLIGVPRLLLKNYSFNPVAD